MSSKYDEPPLNPEPLPDAKPVMAEPFPPTGATAYSPSPIAGTPEPPRKKSGCTCVGCLLGCLGVMVLAGIAAGIGGWWVYKKAPDFARGVAASAIEQSDLNEDDKRMLTTQLDRLVQGYKDGKIDNQKLGEFFQRLGKSPLMDLMITYAAKVKYIDPSGLTPEEKASAERILQRVTRGVVEEKIAADSLDAALNHISTEDANGSRQFRENVTDDELRAFIAECRKLAEAANIPDVEYHIDIGDEVKRLVDETLGETPLTAEREVP